MKFLVEIKEIWVEPNNPEQQTRVSPVITIQAPDKEFAKKLAMSLFCTHKDSIRDVTIKQIDEP